MRISLVTHGTRGDVQPMLVIGEELRRRGHDVALGLPENLAGVGAGAGFPTIALPPDSAAAMRSPEGQEWLASGNVRAFTAALAEMSHASYDRFSAAMVSACEGADLIVAGILAEDVASAVAEAAGIPLVTLHSAPLRRTSGLPHPLVTTRGLPGPVNRLTGALFERVWWRGLRGDLNGLRQQLGLPGQRRTIAAHIAGADSLELQAYSPLLVPEITDLGPRRPMIGAPVPDEQLRKALGDPEPDPLLEDWLGAADAPAYFGFGSMPITDPQEALAMITRVTGELGMWALVSAGWNQVTATDDVGDRIMLVDAVDHDKVLPRCRLAMHHGGSGTTHASLAAGLPTAVCSVFADQPFWGARVEALGVGTHVRFAELDDSSLTAALRALRDDDVRTRAKSLSARLAETPSAGVTAADLIEAELARPARWPGSRRVRRAVRTS